MIAVKSIDKIHILSCGIFGITLANHCYKPYDISPLHIRMLDLSVGSHLGNVKHLINKIQKPV